MLRRDRRENRMQNTLFSKIARYFGMLMTLIYVALGLFIIFAESDQLNLNLTETVKWVLGGTFILYGVVRFVRIYQTKIRRNDDNIQE